MKYIANNDLQQGEELIAWSLDGSNVVRLESASRYPHYITSGIASRNFARGEELTEEEALACGLVRPKTDDLATDN